MKNSISIGADMLLDQLIWCATRYCIGRSSYVTTYAEDYWRVIHRNRNKFNPDRLKFFARDIRAYVSDVVGGYSNVRVENAYNDRIVYDAYTLLTKHLGAVAEVPRDKRYVVDCLSGEVAEEPYMVSNHGIYFNPTNHAYDLLPWVRFANCIDHQYEVTCEKDGKIEKAVCIQDPDGTYTCVDNWRRAANARYIKDIKTIEL